MDRFNALAGFVVFYMRRLGGRRRAPIHSQARQPRRIPSRPIPGRPARTPAMLPHGQGLSLQTGSRADRGDVAAR